MDADEVREREQRQAGRDAARHRHEGNLAVVDALLALEREVTPGPWRTSLVQARGLQVTDTASLHAVSEVPGETYPVVEGTLSDADAALVAALRTGALDALRARRRALTRHAPDTASSTWPVECGHCFDGQENPLSFPCEDYTDAEAGLVMPHRTLVSLDEAAQLASVGCICCGWARTFTYARRLTGAPVAFRLAQVWAGRHVSGDPAARLDTGP